MNILHLNPVSTIVADPRMCNESVKKLWRSFLLGKGDLILQPGKENTFRLGNTPLPVLTDGKEYALAVDEKGVTAAAYIALPTPGSAQPPKEIIEFVLDRPFLFVITKDQIPLFAGVINQV